LRIVCISDTHELHRELIVPRGDMLIHAGDFTFFSKRRGMIQDFNTWLGELPHGYKVVIPGNHEFAFEADQRLRNAITNARLLISESAVVDGHVIWGSPITPMYGGAFGLSASKDRVQLYRTIPANVEILITHTPPFGILDLPPGSTEHGGCPELRDAANRLRPRLHVLGHIHGAYGRLSIEDTIFVNAESYGEFGHMDHAPIVVDIPEW
jgi:Icc-related predicted phosphoesterase